MLRRCHNCASWRRFASDPTQGECWSPDRLDGDMSKGPAGVTYGDSTCEAHIPVEWDYRRDPCNWPENIR